MKILLLVLFIIPNIVCSQPKSTYNINLYGDVGNFWRVTSGKLLAVTDAGLTFRDHKRQTVTIAYDKIKKLKIQKDKKGFNIVDVTASAGLGIVAGRLIGESKSVVNSAGILVIGSAASILVAGLLNSIVHPLPANY